METKKEINMAVKVEHKEAYSNYTVIIVYDNLLENTQRNTNERSSKPNKWCPILRTII